MNQNLSQEKNLSCQGCEAHVPARTLNDGYCETCVEQEDADSFTCYFREREVSRV